MKQFFKFITASCLGTILALISIVLVFLLVGALSGGKEPIKKNSVLRLNISHMIPEKTDNVPEDDPFSFEETTSIGVHRITQLIEHAKTDNTIKGIVLDGEQSGIGLAHMFQLEEALRDFKESEKFVYSYGNYYTQQGYFLSSVADSIFMWPEGGVDLRGLSVSVMFLKDFLDKLGVEMEIFYAGDFKSATEPYRRTSMSDENRLQLREFLQSINKNFVGRIDENRGFESGYTQSSLTNYEHSRPEGALENGFVDRLLFPSDFDDLIRDTLGIEKEKGKINYISLYDYHDKAEIKSKTDTKNKIAVVIAEGDVLYKTGEKGTISEEKYVPIFDKIIKDKKIKAVVLRVNSGGGSALTSDIIWKKVEELKATGKPIIASFGNYAASGGYYIACGADTIVAEPNSLTGSIGVFSMLPKVKKMFEEKLGIQMDTVKTAPLAVTMSPFFYSSQKEKELMEKGTDDIYDRFLSIVAEGRGMTKEAVHEVAQGRIWSGEDAVENGLVDVLGGLDDAIDLAANSADLESYSLKYYPYIKENPYKKLISEIMKDQSMVKGIKLSKKERDLLKKYNQLKRFASYEGPMARIPFIFE